jgi:hypothetical protein
MASPPAADIVQPDQIRISIAPAKRSFTATASTLAVWFLVVYLVSQLVFVYVNHIPTFSWWRKGDPDKSFSHIMSIWGVMMWMNGSYLLYYTLMLFSPGPTRLTDAQIQFMVGKLFPFQTWTDDKGVPRGILTPHQLCKTILLTTKDPQPDSRFVAWMAKHQHTRTEASIQDQDPTLALSFDPASQIGGLWDYSNPKKLKNGTYGVYPLAASRPDWMGCIQAWANGGIEKTDKLFYWQQDGGTGIWTLAVASGQTAKSDKWFDVDNQPDNVFARYNIAYDNPLIVSFVNGAFNFPGMGMKPDAVALQNLIWAESGLAGGWIGFIKGLGPEASSDDIHNILYTSVKFPPDHTAPGCGKSRWAAAAPAGVGTLAGLAVMAPMVAGSITSGLVAADIAVAASGPVGWFAAAFIIIGLSAAVYFTNVAASNPC